MHSDSPKVISIRYNDSRQKIDSNRFVRFDSTVRPIFSYTNSCYPWYWYLEPSVRIKNVAIERLCLFMTIDWQTNVSSCRRLRSSYSLAVRKKTVIFKLWLVTVTILTTRARFRLSAAYVIRRFWLNYCENCTCDELEPKIIERAKFEIS